mmetsp:Transcript_5436/g.11192  ORF Transcript_5436/g.11192 Transcript_5436/m.11192 type:complete len:82 (-) Transcript_5436:3178-3423(-)
MYIVGKRETQGIRSVPKTIERCLVETFGKLFEAASPKQRMSNESVSSSLPSFFSFAQFIKIEYAHHITVTNLGHSLPTVAS